MTFGIPAIRILGESSLFFLSFFCWNPCVNGFVPLTCLARGAPLPSLTAPRLFFSARFQLASGKHANAWQDKFQKPDTKRNGCKCLQPDCECGIYIRQCCQNARKLIADPKTGKNQTLGNQAKCPLQIQMPKISSEFIFLTW